LLKRPGTIALNPDCFEFDIKFIQALPSADQNSLQVIADHFRGPFLQGLSFHENGLYEWLCQQREQYEHLGINAHKKLLQQQLEGQNFQDAIDNAEKLVLLDSVDEEVHCQLMRAYSASGQRHRVMRQYQKLSESLEQHQLGKPQSSTDLLFQSLYHETVVQPKFELESTAPEKGDIDNSSGQIPAIAVLPFNDLMSKPESQALSMALTEETVTELRRFHGFRVISALSSMSLRNQELDLATTSKILGARYLVSGSIRQSQFKIQVAIELVDAFNGELIWADRYTRKLQDLFVLQAELARDIAGSIEPEAVGHSYLLSNRKVPASLSAWELVLCGDRQLYKQLGTRQNSDEVQRLYRSAMQLDPDYAPAYSGLAYSLCLELKDGIATDSQNVELQMLENAQQGVRLDDGNPWCQVILGRAQQQLQEYDAAVIAYRKAVELCPSSAKAHFGLGFGLSTTGQFEKSIKSLNRAIELSPRDPMSWSFHTVKALTYIYSGDLENAAASSALSSSFANSNHWAPAIHAPTLVHLGRYDEAQKVLEKA
jgi:TolB-like protein/Tfp pilus assembly protein PilF